MNSTLAKIDAVENGYDDAIMLGDNDVVAEGSGQNLFLIKNGKIFTPCLLYTSPSPRDFG